MATRTILVDDIDGTDADLTIAFVINGDAYTLDLSKANSEKFYRDIEPYIKAARNRKRKKMSIVQGEVIAVEQRSAIREWAKKKGYGISDRGRIPMDIIEAFNKEHEH